MLYWKKFCYIPLWKRILLLSSRVQVDNCLNGGNDRVLFRLNEAYPQVINYMFDDEQVKND